MKKSKPCEADVPSELRNEVENHYKLSLPEDFYHFWKFCEELDPEKPCGELLQNHSSTKEKIRRHLMIIRAVQNNFTDCFGNLKESMFSDDIGGVLVFSISGKMS